MIAMRNTKCTAVMGNGSLAPPKVIAPLGPPASNANLARDHDQDHLGRSSGIVCRRRGPSNQYYLEAITTP
jgi:hypothetical protein